MKPAAGRPEPRRPNGRAASPDKGKRRTGKAVATPSRDVTGSIGKIVILLILVGGVGIIAYNAFRGGAQVGAAVVEPATLSPVAATGKALFAANCATCHGAEANGTDHGPPFVNDIYNPGHHPDEAFLFAAKNGVRAHHWRFGNMPPVQGVTDADVSAIVRYVRELQEANGIRFRPHVM
jgi:mono/diheme cytochrome c family protein